MSQDAIVIMLGLGILLALKIAWRPSEAGVPQPDDPDRWATPFYLRYNTPLFDTSSAVLPTGSNYPFALGVPIQQLGGGVRQLQIGGV